MAAIIASIISGFFSLAVIWYQNSLQKKSLPANNDVITPTGSTNKSKNQPNIILRIFFTLLIVVCPFLLLLTVGKETISGGDKYLWEYYFVWIIITLTALLFGWKTKTLFEKIILIISLMLLIFMTVAVMNGM